MYVSNDGWFEPTSVVLSSSESYNYLDGVFHLRLREAEHKLLVDAFFPHEENGTPKYIARLIGRSGHAQVGLDILPNSFDDLQLTKKYFRLPVRVVSLCHAAWLDSILELQRDGVKISIGRLLIIEQSTRLDKERLTQAIERDYIGVGHGFEVNSDGSLSFPIQPLSFIVDPRSISEKYVRESILINSRNALYKYQDVMPVDTLKLPGRSVRVFGLRVSTGPFAALIRPNLSDRLRHLQSGLFLDALRSTRIGHEYEGTGVRQVELFNESKRTIKLDANTKITLDFYETGNIDNWSGRFSSRSVRRFSHKHGFSLVELTSLNTPTVVSELFKNVTSPNSNKKLHGKLITTRGVTNIERQQTGKFQRLAIERAVGQDSRQEPDSTTLEEFTSCLGCTIDQSRVLVTYVLPTADELVRYSELGVRSFVFKAISPFSDIPGTEHIINNIFMDGHLHQTIHQLWNSGCSFTHCNYTANAQKTAQPLVREFFAGFWVQPDAKPRLDNIEIVIAMFGWHKEKIATASSGSIQRMFETLASEFGSEHVAVIHGKGPGLMQVADRMARKVGFLSIGIGIDVESSEQFSNNDVEVALDFIGKERLYRQNVMDSLATIKIFNIGGFGTMEEIAVNICSSKLLEVLPAPLIFVDESCGKSIHGRSRVSRQSHWASLSRQVDAISHTSSFEFTNLGEAVSIELDGYPLGPVWISRAMHLVTSYGEASNLIIAFLNDPVDFWQGTLNMDPRDIQRAWTKYRSGAERYKLYGCARRFDEELTKLCIKKAAAPNSS